ncbi:hypothetical protein ACQCN2_19680 [Brevibacillus ginsengisoli]|uniref:hypothetical protein n=1 Tax=Brevibacillus ginsengisoli TaxID=363854 RepID=UPI003CF8B6FE
MAFNSASLLSSLGKIVRVYKGGPESKIGRLISVTESYILLDTLNEGVIFYNLEHIKSMSEDLNVTYAPAIYRPDDYFVRFSSLPTLNEVLESMKYSLVRVDRGGPESRVGRLLGVAPDFFVLSTKEDGILYYTSHHIRSITEEPGNEKVLSQYPNYVDAPNLSNLLTNLHNRWVKINRGGPEMVEGILTDNWEDYVVVIHNKEIYRIAVDHIRNISYTNSVAVNQNSEAINEEDLSQNQVNQGNSLNEKKNWVTIRRAKRISSKSSKSGRKNRIKRGTKTTINRLRYSRRSVIQIVTSRKQRKQVRTPSLGRRNIQKAKVSRKQQRQLVATQRSRLDAIQSRKSIWINHAAPPILTISMNRRGGIQGLFIQKGASIRRTK